MAAKKGILKDIDRTKVRDIALIVGIGAGAFAVFKLLQEFGLIDTKEERRAKKEAKIAEEKLKKSKAEEESKACSTGKQTQGDTYWSGVADGIHESLKYSAVSDNKAEAERLLKMPKNNCDVLALIRLYGKRQLYVFGLPDGDVKTLQQTVISELSTSRITNVNKDYEKKGITLRF